MHKFMSMQFEIIFHTLKPLHCQTQGDRETKPLFRPTERSFELSYEALHILLPQIAARVTGMKGKLI